MSEQKRQGRDPRESMAPTVRIDPVGEAIARKLSGYGSVPDGEKARMIMRAVKAGRDAVHEELEQLRADAELGRAVREEIPKLAAQLSPRGRASLSFLREGAWQVDEYRSWHCPAAVHATPLEAIKAARQAMEGQKP